MDSKVILLVEDNPDDEALTLRAFAKSNIANQVVVARDGVEALDFLFGTGSYAGRDLRVQPQVILLDLKLPKLDGLEVLRRLRADERTAAAASGHSDLVKRGARYHSELSPGANSYIRKPVDFLQFIEAVRQLGLYWLVLNEAAPRIASA